MFQRLKRIAIGVGAGLALLAGGIWILINTLGEKESHYRGKPLEYWVERLNSPDIAISNRVRLICDEEIIPRLRAQMFNDTSDSTVRLLLIEKLNQLPGVMIYFTPADGRRAQAASALGQLGPCARSAIPDLITALKGKDAAVRSSTAKTLGEIHSEPERII